jgi:chaperonin GroEL
VRTDIENAAILATNWRFDDPALLVPALEAARAAKASGLVVIADRLSEKAISLLLANSKAGQFRAIAVKAPGIGHTKQTEALQDIVTLAGGTLFLRDTGQTRLNGLKPQDLGRARKVWADRNNLGVTGGRGNPRQLRQHIAGLRAAYRRAGDVESRKELQERLGKLIAGSATLRIGGATDAEIRARQAIAEQTCDARRGAIIHGVLPGGGMALLACQPLLEQKLTDSENVDERAAYRILIRAMAEPLRVIAANAGYEPSEVMARLGQAGPDHGFDVLTGQVVDFQQAGLYDSAGVLKRAVQSAIAGAALALTTEVLVHHKKPPMAAAQGPGAV